MVIVGLTGGIASGKTTVAHLFSQWGVDVIDADLVGREILEKNKIVSSEIKKKFGKEICKTSGKLDTKKLRKIIFENKNKKIWLEKLLHPMILEKIKKKIKKIKSSYGIVVIPLLLETGPFPFIDHVLLVDVSPATQIKRLRARDGLTVSEARAALANQLSRRARLLGAQDIILNEDSTSFSELAKQAKKLHKRILAADDIEKMKRYTPHAGKLHLFKE